MMRFRLRSLELRHGPEVAARIAAAGTVSAGGVTIAPEDYQAARLPTPKPRPGLGDLVHAVALPIARGLKLPCVDPATRQLRPESKCAQRRAEWNRLTGG